MPENLLPKVSLQEPRKGAHGKAERIPQGGSTATNAGDSLPIVVGRGDGCKFRRIGLANRDQHCGILRVNSAKVFTHGRIRAV